MTLETTPLVVLSSVLLTEVHVVQLLQIGFGQWYYPDGLMVPNDAAGQDFYRTRGNNQTIYLNRKNDAQTPTGSFCCELPDNVDVTHTLCVSLGTAKLAILKNTCTILYILYTVNSYHLLSQSQWLSRSLPPWLVLLLVFSTH